MKKRKAFTLIELISVLVILAILALIVTPLVLNIIRKARVSADKRSIDAYGRSVELAIADYLLDKGDFPTSIEDLTIEYSGDQVVCSTTQLNEDSSVYLADCTVGGRSVDYTYGKEEIITYKSYSVGDEITYKGVNFYVIEDSDTKNDTVKMLKSEPLTVEEVNTYGVGHINRYTSSSVGTAYDIKGYGAMAYYTSSTCGWINNDWVSSGCTTDYNRSEIKYVVDEWASMIFGTNGYNEVRLISKNEYISNCQEEEYLPSPSLDISIRYIPKYDWLYNSSYWQWTITQYDDSNSYVAAVDGNGSITSGNILGYMSAQALVVRPVIVLNKSVLN